MEDMQKAKKKHHRVNKPKQPHKSRFERKDEGQPSINEGIKGNYTEPEEK